MNFWDIISQRSFLDVKNAQMEDYPMYNRNRWWWYITSQIQDCRPEVFKHPLRIVGKLKAVICQEIAAILPQTFRIQQVNTHTTSYLCCTFSFGKIKLQAPSTVVFQLTFKIREVYILPHPVRQKVIWWCLIKIQKQIDFLFQGFTFFNFFGWA